MAIPLNIITLYADLVQDLHMRQERPASLYKRTLKGIEYFYAKRPAGTTRRDMFIGRADTPSVQQHVAIIEAETQRAADRRITISALRAAGIPAPIPQLGHVLDALDDSGLMRSTVLVGTAAYQCYPPFLGDLLPNASLTTEDADIATMSLALVADTDGDTLEAILRRADETYSGLLELNPRALPSRFRAKSGFTVDILTPVLRRDDPHPMPMHNLRAGAAPLQHLRWLIENPLQAASIFGSGIPLFVPQPARYAVHKLIIAQKRAGGGIKRFKDLAQAKAIIDILKTRDPYALEDARDAAFAEGKEGWEVPIMRSLKELKLNAEFEAV